MAIKTLAVKYRPKTFDDVVEQESIKVILQQQLKEGMIKNAYLFTGGAGTGKTTCARIFAHEINKGTGSPIELDAASNNSVDDMRDLIQQAQTKSLDGEYKVFIVDECHMITVQGWNALLKLIEEPPAKSIFIFCTTDPQKIPKTILSRVQRYDFQRISQQSIVDRLAYILKSENIWQSSGDVQDDGDMANDVYNALEYIAKIADGGMRDAITLMDKCLSYSDELTLENVVKVLGTVDYSVMLELSDSMIDNKLEHVVKIIESIHTSGKDLKQFIRQYLQFLLDVKKYGIGCDWQFLVIPRLPEYEKWLDSLESYDYLICSDILDIMMRLVTETKYSSTVKLDIEASLLTYAHKEE